MTYIPNPNGMLAMMGTIQCTLGYVVKANQNNASGQMTAPYRPLMRCASGGGWRPSFLAVVVYCLVNNGLTMVAKRIPLKKYER